MTKLTLRLSEIDESSKNFVGDKSFAVAKMARGGLKVPTHNGLIAREYGLHCITGVPNAVDLIENGQEIVVDGYLGIVTIKTTGAEKCLRLS